MKNKIKDFLRTHKNFLPLMSILLICAGFCMLSLMAYRDPEFMRSPIASRKNPTEMNKFLIEKWRGFYAVKDSKQ